MSSARTGLVPSRYVLADLPVRALLFLRGVAFHAAIRRAMAEGGFGEADHREGSRLLEAVYAWHDGGMDPNADRSAREAGEAVIAFVRDHFPRLRAALERLHPEHASVFKGLDASTSAEALAALGTFLVRLDMLDGTGAPETLAQRGVGPAKRRQLAELIATALSVTAPATTGPLRVDREAESLALYRWYTDWAATARALIKRKDWLVTLGLSGRKRARAERPSASEAL